MSCLPGMPCFGGGRVVYPRGCGVDPCVAVKSNTDLVFYSGPNLPCTGVNTCDSLTLVLEKIDNQICDLIDCCFNATSSTTTSSTTTSIPCHCFTIEGGGPSSPIYLVQYQDCDGVYQQTGAGQGISIAFCAQVGTVNTQAVFVDNGPCTALCVPPTTTTTTTVPPTTTTTTTTPPCNCYTVTNGSAFINTLTYTDCDGVVQSGISVDPAATINFCAQVGSVIYNGPGGDITDNGACLGNPICTTTTTTTIAP